jgi:hypothetical protein
MVISFLERMTTQLEEKNVWKKRFIKW